MKFIYEVKIRSDHISLGSSLQQVEVEAQTPAQAWEKIVLVYNAQYHKLLSVELKNS